MKSKKGFLFIVMIDKCTRTIYGRVYQNKISRNHYCRTLIHTTRLFINNEEIESQSSHWFDLKNPSNQDIISQVPYATQNELQNAIDAAQNSFPTWKETSILKRQNFMLNFRSLLKSQIDTIAQCITREHGKTLQDAYAELERGIEAMDHACSLPSLILGETVSNLTNNIKVETFHEPLGVCLGITPFNFPAMLPLWMFPMSLMCGNTFVLKPSEKCPGAVMHMARLAKEAGIPKGVLNIVHGGRDVVESLCDSKSIRAISFVGSELVGRQVYTRGILQGKRVQANLSAKNHAVIMPDANRQHTLDQLIGAAFGSTGQRCMSISVAIFVGNSFEWVNDLIEKARHLKLNHGFAQNVDIGPMISSEAKQRIINSIEISIAQGAQLLLDGRKLINFNSLEKGNFLGPTILSRIHKDMDCYDKELFGPVLLCISVKSLDEAMEWLHPNRFGNSAAIFTNSGETAYSFQKQLDIGQIGVNMAIPVPPATVSFTGSRDSFLGDMNFQGKSSFFFYTQTKTVMSRWFPNLERMKDDENLSSSCSSNLRMPTLD